MFPFGIWKMVKKLTCQDIADYFLILVDREAGDSITQLKLQKLVYFAQGISLALLDKPLFENAIEAWEHGPVVRELRKKFGEFGPSPLPPPGEIEFDVYNSQQKELIYRVYSTYGEHSASYLRNLTHEHSIWQEAYNHQGNTVISQEKIRHFFKGIVAPDFLSTSKEDGQNIVEAEDRWWMNYDSGVASEDITKEIV